MAWPSTLTWKLAEKLQTNLSKNSPFKGADWGAELDNIYNAINYLAGNGMGEPLASIAALRAVPAESGGPFTTDVPRRDKQLRRVDAVIGPSSSTSTQIYQFRSGSAAADADAGDLDTDGIVSPDSGSGRWHRVPSNAIYNRGADGLVTFYRNGITDLNTDTYGDIAWKYLGKSASSFIKLTFNKELRIRNDADSDYQDVLLKALTASGNITGQGTNNKLTGTPPASATQALLEQGTAPVGASAAGTYRTINAAAGFTGDYTNYQLDGVSKHKIDKDGNSTQSGNVIAAGTNNRFTASPAASTTEALVRLINALSAGHASGTILGGNATGGYGGDLINLQIGGTTRLKVDATGRTKGAQAVANDEFTTLLQMNNAIAASTPFFGTGADGVVTISGNTTLTTDKYYSTLTVNAGVTLTLAGFVVFVSGTFNWNGTVAFGNGGNGTNGGLAPSPGAAGTNTRGSLPVLNGLAGGTGSNGACTAATSNNIYTDKSSGTAGKNGEGCSNGGTVVGHEFLDVVTAIAMARASATGLFAHGQSGSGGAGTAGSGTRGDGGGSGASGQTGLICAQTIAFGGSSAVTGNGGNGGNGGDSSGTGSSGGGGASGGPGSLGVLVYSSKSGSLSSTTLTGGTKGAHGLNDGANPGTFGLDGAAGYIIEVDI